MVMQRCVAIHANGTSEVLEFQPRVHRELRRLGYRRFVVQTADGRSLSSAVYARATPSTWQFSNSAKQLWGLTGDVQGFDEHGEPIRDTLTPAGGIATIPRFVEPGVRVAPVPRATAPPKTRIHPRQVPELIARANHSLPDADPRKITRALVDDLSQAARALRWDVSASSCAESDDPERRALADRIDARARALGSYLRPRDDSTVRE